LNAEEGGLHSKSHFWLIIERIQESLPEAKAVIVFTSLGKSLPFCGTEAISGLIMKAWMQNF
jgi:hypothetical protein